MSDREKCLRLLTGFVRTGDIDKGATAAAMIVNYLTTLDTQRARAEALDDLRLTLAATFEQEGISGPAEERHVVVEDALDKARQAIADMG